MKKTIKESSKTSSSASRGKILSVLLLTLFLNLFLFHRIGSVATALVFGAYSVFSAITFLGRGIFKQNKFLSLGLIFVNLLFGLTILTIDNSFSRFVVLFSWFWTTSFSIYLFLEDKPFFADLEEMILAPVNMAISYVLSVFSILGKILSGDLSEFVSLSKNDRIPVNLILRILIGGVISIPVIAILVGLLSSGDPVFAYKVTRVFQEIGKVFEIKFWFQPIVHLIFSIIILAGFLPLALIKLRKIPLKYVPNKLPLGTEIAVLLGLVAVVLGSFLIVDFPYVFANVPETALARFGVNTYSEYVRRGFFEFLAVSLIVYGVIWAGLGALRFAQGKPAIRKILMFFQTILFIEFGVFIISIFRRIFLYQQFHGWSLARIYGGIFLVWVLGLLIVLAARHFYQKSLLLAEVLLTLFVIVFVGLFNSENFIVTTHPPTVNKRVDYVYLSKMSTDGYVGWVKSYQYANAVLNKNWVAAKEVCIKYGLIEVHGILTNKTGCVQKEGRYVVDSDGRREIAYAGMIVHNLLLSSSQLTADYGTDEEKKTFAKIALAPIGGGDNFSDVGIDLSGGPYYYNANAGEFNSFFFVVPKADKSDREYGVVDSFYNWNYSRWLTYQKMKEEMPISKLNELQNKYFKYYDTIIAQPDSEKDFDMDISTLSPLL